MIDSVWKPLLAGSAVLFVAAGVTANPDLVISAGGTGYAGGVYLGIYVIRRQLQRATGMLLAICLALLAITAIADYSVGYDMDVTVLYYLPIILAGWALSPAPRYACALCAGLAWYAMHALTSTTVPPSIVAWNAVVQTASLLAVSYAVAAARASRVAKAKDPGDSEPDLP
jgi:hypothetical protein